MINLRNIYIIPFLLFAAGMAYAELVIQSPNGHAVIFSQPQKGELYDDHAWKKILFSSDDKILDLSQSDRYYVEDGQSKTSPSGNFLIIHSISGGDLEQDNNSKIYVDRAYCSVVDMRDGCIVSDWSGEACGYDWVDNQDILADSNEIEAHTFDFLSMRPTFDRIKTHFLTIDIESLDNIMRCDEVSQDNIHYYQQLLQMNKTARKAISLHVLTYLNKIENESPIKTKAHLYASPEINSRSKGYLIKGDRVKIIQYSSDAKWAHIGYVNAKGMPFIAWIKTDVLDN